MTSNAQEGVFTSNVQIILIVTRLGKCHLTQRRVRVTIVAVGKQKYYRIFR